MEYSLTLSQFPKVTWSYSVLILILMEYSLTYRSLWPRFGSASLNPYSNGILSDNLKESILDFLLYSSPLLETRIRQRVSSIRKIFSQMYLFSSFIPNKNEHLFA